MDSVKSSESDTRTFFKALSQEKYEMGHKDPRKPLTVENMVMQPTSINRAYRDAFIFDHNGLPRVPNPNHLKDNMDRFYSEEDQKTIYEILKRKFE